MDVVDVVDVVEVVELGDVVEAVEVVDVVGVVDVVDVVDVGLLFASSPVVVPTSYIHRRSRRSELDCSISGNKLSRYVSFLSSATH